MEKGKDLIDMINKLPDSSMLDVLKYLVQINPRGVHDFALEKSNMQVEVDFCCRNSKDNLCIEIKGTRGTRQFFGFKGNKIFLDGLILISISRQKVKLIMNDSLLARLKKNNLTSLD